MPQERLRRLEILSRRNYGRTEHPQYLVELSQLLGKTLTDADVLSIEETDRLYLIHKTLSKRSNVDAAFAFSMVWKYQLQDAWLRVCRCVGTKLANERAALFVGPFELCGGVVIEVGRILLEPQPVLEFDKNTIGVQSLTAESGLYLDMYEEGSDQFVQLVAWGDWKPLAIDCSIETTTAHCS